MTSSLISKYMIVRNPSLFSISDDDPIVLRESYEPLFVKTKYPHATAFQLSIYVDDSDYKHALESIFKKISASKKRRDEGSTGSTRLDRQAGGEHFRCRQKQ